MSSYFIKTDSSGRTVTVGAAASGSTVAGNPVLIAGSDGVDAQTLATDTSGHAMVVGASAFQAPITGNPVTMGVVSPTGTNLYAVGDTEGHLIVDARGYDNGTWRNIRADPNGSLIISSGTAVGDSAEVFVPFVQGVIVDGAGTVQTALGDAAGRQIMVGSAANGTAVTGNPVLMAGSDGTSALTLTTDLAGRQVMVGAAASGISVAGNPVLMGGSDGTNARSINTDTQGRISIVGSVAENSLISDAAYPVMVGVRGQDNNTHYMLADASGRSIVVGHVASGDPPTGNPILIAGFDGTSTQSLKTDTQGRTITVGATASGSALTGNPVLIAGSDGMNAITLSTNASGELRLDNVTTVGQITQEVTIVGKDIAGAVVTGNPVLIAGSDGTNALTLATDAAGRLSMIGSSADGAAVSGNPVLTAGVDDVGTTRTVAVDATGKQSTINYAVDATSTVRSITSDTSGRLITVGPAASGSALDGNPILIAGSDGTNARSMAVDTSGNAVVVGASALQAPVAGNPVTMGVVSPTGTNLYAAGDTEGHLIVDTRGYDNGTWRNVRADANGSLIISSGTAVGDSAEVFVPFVQGVIVEGTGTVQTALGDATGRQIMVGAAASGTAVTGNPVLIAGSDGTNTLNVATDSSGRLTLVGSSADGAAVNGNPVLTAGVDSYGNTQTLSVDATGKQAVINYVVDTTSAVRSMTSDTSGRLITVGAAASGSAAAGNPVLIAGSDGTHAVTLKTNVSGELVVDTVTSIGQITQEVTIVGKDAAGTAATGNPVLMAGTDGSTVLNLITDTVGRQIMVGASGSGTAATGNPVLMGGSDGSTVLNLITDTVGRQIMVGATGSGTAVAGNPVLIGGSDGSTVFSVTTDGFGRLIMVGAAGSGTAADGNPVLMGGSDGSTVLNLITDTVGRQIMVGATGSGTAVTGNPVLMAGSDGSVAVSLFTDVDGRQIIIGPAASGTPLVGNPILSGGSDGTNALTLTTDSTGRQIMVGATASGSALDGNPILIAGSDGTNAQALATDVSGRQIMIGAAAEGAAVVNNPVLISGRYDSGGRTLTNGTNGAVALESDAKLKVSLYGTDGTSDHKVKLDTQGVLLSRSLPDYTFYMHGEASGTGAQLILTPNSGVYTPQTFRSQGGSQFPNYFKIVSSDNDNMYGVSGLQQITVEGYRTSGALFISETINLNGTTPVLTTQAYNVLLRVTGTVGNLIPGSFVTVRPDDYNTTMSYLEITETDLYNPVFYNVNAASYCTHISISTDIASTFSIWRVNCSTEERTVCWRRRFTDTFDYEMDFGPTGAFKVQNNEYIVVMNEGLTNSNTTFSLRFDSYKF